MKTRTTLITAAVAVVMTASLFAADIKLEGIKCILNPKGAAKSDKFVKHNGGKVYFCCANCPKNFDAAKHGVKANHQMFATKQFKQEKCPLTGRPIDKTKVVKVGGTDVALCCGGCKGKVAKAKGDAQAKLVFADKPFKKGFKLAKAEKKKD